MSEENDALPGYGPVDPESLKLPAEFDGWTEADWRDEFFRTRDLLQQFLQVRDPLAVLAKTSMRHMIEAGDRSPTAEGELPPLEQGEVELVQALLLAQSDPHKNTPTSPGNFVRFWPMLGRHVLSFIRKQPERPDVDPVVESVTRRARLQTIHYRNLFYREDCERTLITLLTRIDAASERDLGYRLSDAYRAIIRVLNIVTERLEEFSRQVLNLHGYDRTEVLRAIDFFQNATPMAKRIWDWGGHRFTETDDLRWSGYQMSEMANAWIYTLPRNLLEQEFPPATLGVIDQLCLKPGELAGAELEHLYMNNPVWQRPYIALPDGAIFAALPQMAVSFPFAIIEGLMAGHPALEGVYEKTRGDYLEDEVATIIRRAMPSAEVYQSVEWTSPASGRTYENDVVALIGNTIFLFEAKAGRIAEAARRGGWLSLSKNFKQLFVEPGEQASRLQHYLNTHADKAALRLKKTGKPIDLRLDKKKIVHTFSICIEHFASLTSAKSYLKELGLVKDETAWSPVLSLGELQLIERFLDTEVEFFHYFTRRATVEELMDFEGDEQDLLAMYLTNGLWVDKKAIGGRKVMFFNADDAVRQRREPRADRTEVVLRGVQLSPMWLATVKEVYRDQDQRHRFDIIEVILNQLPPALQDIERRVRRWRRGENHQGQDTIILRYEIGDRSFVLVAHLMKRIEDGAEWQRRSREIGYGLGATMGATDCVVFLYLRKSKEITFDGVSFFRLNPNAPEADLPKVS